MNSALENAISALKLATECGGDLDHEHYVQAYRDLVEMRDKLLVHDNRLNEEGKAPDGDDYNALWSIVGLTESGATRSTTGSALRIQLSGKIGSVRLSQLVENLQADLEANGDTEHVALCLAIPPGRKLEFKPYAHRLDAHGNITILRDTAEYVNGMTYLVADFVG